MHMKLEFVRSINNKIYLYSLISCLLSFILGYILLISLDKVEYVSLIDFRYSVYTVYTQFGFFIFTVIAIYMFTLDYKQKNILFYKNINVNVYKWYISKVIILIFWLSLGTFICLFTVSILYKDFSNFVITFIYFENILMYIVLISSLFGLLFKNVLTGFCFNMFLWIFGIIMATTSENLNYLSYYDAGLEHHDNFYKFLEGNNYKYISLFNDFIYNIVVFCFVILIISIFKKRWVKNGV